MGVIYFTERVFFLPLCTCTPTNSKYLFFCHSAWTITLSVSLIHCFHDETSFALDLQFYNWNNGGTLAFRKIRFGEKLLAMVTPKLDVCRYRGRWGWGSKIYTIFADFINEWSLANYFLLLNMIFLFFVSSPRLFHSFLIVLHVKQKR